MSNEVLKSASHGEQFGLESVVMLEEPIVELDDGAILRILAVYTDIRDGQRAPLGYVSTKSGHVHKCYASLATNQQANTSHVTLLRDGSERIQFMTRM